MDGEIKRCNLFLDTRESYNTDIQISNSNSQPIKIEIAVCISKRLRKTFSIIKNIAFSF